MNNEFENKIASAFEQLVVPDNVFEKISDSISASDKKRTVVSMTKKKKSYMFALPLTACLMVVLVIGAFIYENNFAVETIVGIDINPSVEISLSKSTRVLDITALNKDADELLSAVELNNGDLNDVIDELVEAFSEEGYLEDEAGSVLVTVVNDDDETASAIRQEIVSGIGSALTDNNSSANVLNQTVKITDDVRKFANENYISMGKASLILNMIAKDSSLNSKELAKMSIAEITILIGEKNIDISDFCDVADNMHDDVSDALVKLDDEFRGDMEDISNIVAISEADAKSKALYHAGLNASDVEWLSAKCVTEGKRNVYYVEFLYADVTYAYIIDAGTGDIISCGTDEPDGPEGEGAVIAE